MDDSTLLLCKTASLDGLCLTSVHGKTTHRKNAPKKKPQTHSGETHRDIGRLHTDKTLRNSNTRSVGKGCSRFAPPCNGRLRHCCSIFRAPQGFFHRSFMCASHNACRTALLVSMCCSQAALASLIDHRAFAFLLLPDFLKLIALCISTSSWYKTFHSCPSTPV